MFGNARLSNGGAVEALLVPDAAVTTDQARKLVVVIGKDGTAQAKPVELGPVVQGLRVIRSGLGPQDRVVIRDTELAQPRATVLTRPGKIVPVAARGSPPTVTHSAAGQAAFEAHKARPRSRLQAPGTP